MTVLLHDHNAHPLAHVAVLTHKICNRRGREGVWQPDLSPTEEMIPVAELLDPANPLLDNIIDRYASVHHTDRRVAASLLWKAYSYGIALPSLASWISNRLILDMSAGVIAFRSDMHRPLFRFGLSECRFIAYEEAAEERIIRDDLLPRILDSHLLPVLLAFRNRTGIGTRNLAGSLAVALTHPFATLTTVLGRDLRHDMEVFRAALGPVGQLIDIADTRDIDGNIEPSPLRRACCQKMRISGETNCMNCPLLSPSRREAISAFHGITWLPTPTPRTN